MRFLVLVIGLLPSLAFSAPDFNCFATNPRTPAVKAFVHFESSQLNTGFVVTTVGKQRLGHRFENKDLSQEKYSDGDGTWSKITITLTDSLQLALHEHMNETHEIWGLITKGKRKHSLVCE